MVAIPGYATRLASSCVLRRIRTGLAVRRRPFCVYDSRRNRRPFRPFYTAAAVQAMSMARRVRCNSSAICAEEQVNAFRLSLDGTPLARHLDGTGTGFGRLATRPG